MHSHNTYHLTWVSLNMDVGYHFMAVTAKHSHCSLPWTGSPFLTLNAPRSGVAAERSYPMLKEWRLRGRRRAERSYSMFKVRRGGHEEIPLVQGKEQQQHFAGAAIKR